MSKRFKYLIFSLLLLIGFHFALIKVFYVTKQKSELSQLLNNYKNNPKEYKFLFIGTSHVKRGVDTSIVQSSYSFAYYGQNNINAYYLLKYLLENYAQNFEYICLPNDFDYYSYRASINLNNKFFYHQFFDYNEYGKLTNSMYKSKKMQLINSYFPYSNLRKMLKSKNKFKGNVDFSLIKPENRQEMASDYVRKGHNITSQDKIYDDISITYLKMTLDLLKKHHKKAIFINFPLSKDMNKEIDRFGNYNHQSDSLIIKSGFPIINLSKVFITHDEYFIDPHHLNNKGGIQSSILVQKELEKY